MRLPIRIWNVGFIVIICIGFLLGCEKKETDTLQDETNSKYKDVIYTTLDNSAVYISKIVPKEGQYKKILTSSDEADIIMNELKPVDNIYGLYNDDYFASHDLLIVAVYTISTHLYTITDIELSGNVLTISMDEKSPRVSTLKDVCKGIFIDLEKDSVPNDVEIVVEMNRIVTDE